MKINTKISADGVNDLTAARRSAPAAPSATDDSSFASTTALQTALKNTPDVRPSAVERAKQLISDPNYPSADTVTKLAGFLADKLTSNSD